MSGRAHRAERRIAVTALECGNCFESGSGGVDRGIPRSRRCGGVRIERAATRGADPFDLVEVGRGVHSLELGTRGGARFEMANGIANRSIVETGQHRLDPLWPLRMPAPRIMLGKTRIRTDQQHPVRLPRSRHPAECEPAQ